MQAGAVDVIEYLVERAKVDINVINVSGDSVLLYACRLGRLDVVRYLVEDEGVDVNLKNVRTGGTALLCACKEGNLQIVCYLLERTTVMTAVENTGSGPLISACEGDALDVIHYLIDKTGADLTAAMFHAIDTLNLNVIHLVVTDGMADEVLRKNRSGIALGTLLLRLPDIYDGNRLAATKALGSLGIASARVGARLSDHYVNHQVTMTGDELWYRVNPLLVGIVQKQTTEEEKKEEEEGAAALQLLDSSGVSVAGYGHTNRAALALLRRWCAHSEWVCEWKGYDNSRSDQHQQKRGW